MAECGQQCPVKGSSARVKGSSLSEGQQCPVKTYPGRTAVPRKGSSARGDSSAEWGSSAEQKRRFQRGHLSSSLGHSFSSEGTLFPLGHCFPMRAPLFLTGAPRTNGGTSPLTGALAFKPGHLSSSPRRRFNERHLTSPPEHPRRNARPPHFFARRCAATKASAFRPNRQKTSSISRLARRGAVKIGDLGSEARPMGPESRELERAAGGVVRGRRARRRWWFEQGPVGEGGRRGKARIFGLSCFASASWAGAIEVRAPLSAARGFWRRSPALRRLKPACPRGSRQLFACRLIGE